MAAFEQMSPYMLYLHMFAFATVQDCLPLELQMLGKQTMYQNAFKLDKGHE